MLVCVYRTLTTCIDISQYYYNNVNYIIMYSISRSIYMQGDSRQMILDILIWIKSNIDRTISFRSSCCEGVCGSCAMLINNSNTLACIQPIWLIESYVCVYPLPHFHVIRDLVVDLKHFYEQYLYVNPFYSLYDSSGYNDCLYSKYILDHIFNLNFLFVNSYQKCLSNKLIYSINYNYILVSKNCIVIFSSIIVDMYILFYLYTYYNNMFLLI